jgi:cell division protein FtsN
MPPNKRRQNTPHGRGPKPWLWLIAGLLSGGLIVLLPSFQDWGPWAEKDTDKAAAVKNTAKAKEASAEQPKLPHFEFYTLLPEMEVAIPEPLISQQQPKPQPKAPAPSSLKPKLLPSKSAPSEVYVLQAGSFRSYTQADKRKAALALMGIEAAIQTVTIDNSKTWHRVRIGPNANLAKLQRIRQQLRDNQIECQLFKVKS